MKARVKATGYIVDAKLSYYVDNVAWYITKCHASYSENELEFIDAPEDYWTRLEHQAAIAAMQGLLQSPHLNIMQEEPLVGMASSIAHALVEKYKKEERK